MASNRHLGRIIALQTLYEQDFRRESRDLEFDLQAVLKRNIARYEATVDDTAFIEMLVKGISESEDQLNALLQPLAPERPIGDISRIVRIILQIGAFELTHENGVPPKVVINEAVELGKAFGSENSSKFINGVLGSLLRQLHPEIATAPATTSAKATDLDDMASGANSSSSTLDDQIASDVDDTESHEVTSVDTPELLTSDAEKDEA